MYEKCVNMLSSDDGEPPKKRLRKDSNAYLIGSVDHQILGAKLPSNRQVLSVYFYNTRIAKLSRTESAKLVADEVAIFYNKARIPIALSHNNSLKVERLVDEYRDLQRSASRATERQKLREEAFTEKLDDLFDMAHTDANNLIKDPEIREFLECQRKKGRVGCLLGVEEKKEEAERKREQRKAQEEERRRKASIELSKTGMKIILKNSNRLNTLSVFNNVLYLMCVV